MKEAPEVYVVIGGNGEVMEIFYYLADARDWVEKQEAVEFPFSFYNIDGPIKVQ